MTALWPVDETFDAEPTSYGTHFLGYMGAQMDSSSYGLGFLHNGYMPAGACVRGKAIDQGSGKRTGWVRRQFFNKNVRARAFSYILNQQGGGNLNQIKTMGVLARVRNGSIVDDSTRTVSMSDADGYAVLGERVSQDSMQFRIVRYDAGTPTYLADTGAILFEPKSFKTPVGLELEVDGDGGGGANIKARLKGPRAISYLPGNLPAEGQAEFQALKDLGKGGVLQFGSIFLNFAEFITILSVNDPSGSAHDFDGRCGFVVGMERTTGTGGIRHHVYPCSLFRVHNLDTSSVVWEDDWNRSSDGGGVVNDLFGTSGHNLGCDWFGDIMSHLSKVAQESDGDFRSTFVRDAANDRVYIDNATSSPDSEIWGISMRPSDSAKNHHRQVTWNYADDSAGNNRETRVGIMLRASHEKDGVGTHYRLEVRIQSNITGFLYAVYVVRRINGVDEVLAYDDLGVQPAEDTDLTLEFEVLPLPGPTQENVQLICGYNGSQVTSWSNDQEVSGIEILPGGEIVDGSGARILSGPQEGIYLLSGADAAASQLRVDTWTQLAFSQPVEPSAVPFDAYIDLAVPDELDGATGELLLDSGWIIEPMQNARRTDDRAVSGKTRRLAHSIVVRESWRISFVGKTRTEIDSLVDFWNVRDGAEVPFTWTPPGRFSSSGTYKFREDSLFHSQIGPDTYFGEAILDKMEPA